MYEKLKQMLLVCKDVSGLGLFTCRGTTSNKHGGNKGKLCSEPKLSAKIRCYNYKNGALLGLTFHSGVFEYVWEMFHILLVFNFFI